MPVRTQHPNDACPTNANPVPPLPVMMMMMMMMMMSGY